MSVRLLVCDLDNTLYDWVSYFVPSFYAMVDKVVEKTGWDRDQLLNDLKAVHQRHHDSEHPFALLETNHVLRMFPSGDIYAAKNFFDDAFHAFNSERKKRLTLYPKVEETLKTLKANDIRLIAHTEAKFHAAADRLRRLGLMEYFELVFCRERGGSKHPDGITDQKWLEGFPIDKVKELSHHQRKPNTDVLLEICSKMGVGPEDTAYIGDSMSHDMKMAVDAKVYAIYAKYGTKRNPSTWEKLVRVTHWEHSDVVREAELRERSKNVLPDYVANESFREALDALKIPVHT